MVAISGSLDMVVSILPFGVECSVAERKRLSKKRRRLKALVKVIIKSTKGYYEILTMVSY